MCSRRSRGQTRAANDAAWSAPTNRWRGAILLALLLLLLPGCRRNAAPSPGNGSLQGGIVATFDVDGEQFKVWVTKAETITQILALRDGTSNANIPNGRILRGPGQASHNAPWSWHLDPQEIEMAEITVEVCDGRPSYVEANVGEFVDNVKRYCPWSARLVEVADHR